MGLNYINTKQISLEFCDKRHTISKLIKWQLQWLPSENGGKICVMNVFNKQICLKLYKSLLCYIWYSVMQGRGIARLEQTKTSLQLYVRKDVLNILLRQERGEASKSYANEASVMRYL